MSTSRRGRPVDRSNKLILRSLDIWLDLEVRKHFLDLKNSRPISINALTKLVADRGGLGSAVGGQVDAILKAMAQETDKFHATRRAPQKQADGTVDLVDDPQGQIFEVDVQRCANTLRARYQEAKAYLKSDANLRRVYEQRLAERIRAAEASNSQ